MNQDRFGNFIKEIRKKYNLTQKEFADRYNVTYQAVSKWENGKNLPDASLMKQISKDFGLTLDEIYDGKYKKNKRIIVYVISIVFLIMIMCIIMCGLLFHKTSNDFKFKTVETTCDQFKISGTVAYNDKKSAIYISNIEYCGGNDTEIYKKVECILYENQGDINKKISSNEINENITLEEYLKNVTFRIDNYQKACIDYKDGSLYLTIKATSLNNKVTTYEVPLKLNSSCNT